MLDEIKLRFIQYTLQCGLPLFPFTLEPGASGGIRTFKWRKHIVYIKQPPHRVLSREFRPIESPIYQLSLS